eukprot:TRINITY_DN171_c0_g1_i7.p2 TRINITY_DN171_c0_g1~~TRINITY_DN171_c0_g1_i7.p2  ORF type:complete len:143 (+),score=35.67 TRINITY_DN171_c0_g1_i7:2-430(+)
MAPSTLMLLSANHNFLTVSFTFNSSAIIFASSSASPKSRKFTISIPFLNCSILSCKPIFFQSNLVDIGFLMDQSSTSLPLNPSIHSSSSNLLFFLPSSSPFSSLSLFPPFTQHIHPNHTTTFLITSHGNMFHSNPFNSSSSY